MQELGGMSRQKVVVIPPPSAPSEGNATFIVNAKLSKTSTS
jgi:hypothetical protein